jgi:hypothetical protein
MTFDGCFPIDGRAPETPEPHPLVAPGAFSLQVRRLLAGSFKAEPARIWHHIGQANTAESLQQVSTTCRSRAQRNKAFL